MNHIIWNPCPLAHKTLLHPYPHKDISVASQNRFLLFLMSVCHHITPAESTALRIYRYENFVMVIANAVHARALRARRQDSQPRYPHRGCWRKCLCICRFSCQISPSPNHSSISIKELHCELYIYESIRNSHKRYYLLDRHAKFCTCLLRHFAFKIVKARYVNNIEFIAFIFAVCSA